MHLEASQRTILRRNKKIVLIFGFSIQFFKTIFGFLIHFFLFMDFFVEFQKGKK